MHGVCAYVHEVHAWDVQVLTCGLEEEPCPVVDYDECLTPAERLLPTRRQPKPGEPQVQSLLCATPSPRRTNNPGLHPWLSTTLPCELLHAFRSSPFGTSSAWLCWVCCCLLGLLHQVQHACCRSVVFSAALLHLNMQVHA